MASVPEHDPRLDIPPREDENGIDLSMTEDCLRLTPAQRLRQLEEFASFVLEVRKANGIEWSNTESF